MNNFHNVSSRKIFDVSNDYLSTVEITIINRHLICYTNIHHTLSNTSIFISHVEQFEEHYLKVSGITSERVLTTFIEQLQSCIGYLTHIHYHNIPMSNKDFEKKLIDTSYLYAINFSPYEQYENRTAIINRLAVY